MYFNQNVFEYSQIFSEDEKKLPFGKLYQVTEVSVIKSGEVVEHLQRCDEITYVVSGKATAYYDGTSCDLSGGEVHFIKKGKAHKIVVAPEENFRYICMGFNLNNEYEISRVFSEGTDGGDQFKLMDDGTVRTLSELLMDEIYAKDTLSDTMINLYISQILVSIIRLINNSKEKNDKESVSSFNSTIYNVLRYIDREYINLKSVGEIARRLSYNECYLSHLFKEKTGITVKEYLLKKKILKAAELLKDENITVAQISDYLNFASPHTFSQAFKRFWGASPKEFRAKQS